MPITLTCPSCNQQCAVKEEYAGMQVRCPRCPGVITVPAATSNVAAVVLEPEPVMTTPVTAAAPPMPPVQRAPAGPGFMDNITKFLAANGVTGVNKILLFVGLGCMAFFLITVMLPWQSHSAGPLRVTFYGIQMGMGIVEFLMVLAMLFLLVFVVLLGWTKLFEYSLWTASNLAIFITLHLLASMGAAAGVGMILALIVMLAAAGTLGVVAFSRVFGSKPN